MVLGGEIGHVPTEVTLDNRQSASHLHWTFQHVADFPGDGRDPTRRRPHGRHEIAAQLS